MDWHPKIHYNPDEMVTEDELINGYCLLWFVLEIMNMLILNHCIIFSRLFLFFQSGAVQWCELHYALPCTCSTQSGSVWVQHAGTNRGQKIRRFFFFFFSCSHTPCRNVDWQWYVPDSATLWHKIEGCVKPHKCIELNWNKVKKNFLELDCYFAMSKL